MTLRVYTDDNLRPETWMRDASCAQIGGDDWFPQHGDLPTAERAKQVCRGCPVRAQCLEFALRTKQRDGIWASYSPKSLERLRRRTP